jgi:hypothetical protein
MFVFIYDISTSLDPTNSIKLSNTNYESKVTIFTPYVFEGNK